MVGAPSSGVTVIVDRTPPTGTLILEYGVWTLHAPEGVQCVLYPCTSASLEMSLDGTTWQTANSYPGTGGPLLLRDKAGNISSIVGTYASPNSGPVQTVSKWGYYYSFVQHAYAVATNNDLIKLKSTTLMENITLSNNTSITIRGGYGTGFSTVSGITSITGNLAVAAGSTVIENISLSGMMTVNGGAITAENLSIL